MKKITQKILDDNANISNEEIARDIQLTNAEIRNAEIKIEGYNLIASVASGAQDRMAQYRADGLQIKVKEKKEFVMFLEALIEARKGQ